MHTELTNQAEFVKSAAELAESTQKLADGFLKDALRECLRDK